VGAGECTSSSYIPGPVDCPEALEASYVVSLPVAINPGTCSCITGCGEGMTLESVTVTETSDCFWVEFVDPGSWCIGELLAEHIYVSLRLDHDGSYAGDGYAAWIVEIYFYGSTPCGIETRYIKRWTTTDQSPTGTYSLLKIRGQPNPDGGTWTDPCTDASADSTITVSL
jgi:hypothetical protein